MIQGRRDSMGRREEEEARGRLELAVRILAGGMSPVLIPGSGSNIGYALRGARSPGDVAGVEGGLVERGGSVHPSGGVVFGAGRGVAGVVLTAMRTDPGIRSAAVIRFSAATVAILEDLLLETCEFDRFRVPPGVSTMDWGVASCCRDGVPDAIFDRGAPGKEGLVRILGEDPVTVAQTIVSVSSRLP
jgi:hydroxymethylpyrimidine/phosphomethylpyrimidine kinase